jgi:hypothetical protein
MSAETLGILGVPIVGILVVIYTVVAFIINSRRNPPR